MFSSKLILAAAIAAICSATACSRAQESSSSTPVYIKFEAEDFGNFGKYKSKDGAWAHRMAWYPQWSRGGDSGWWAAEGNAKAAAGDVALDFFVPQTAPYTLWVRYEDYHGQPEPFDVTVDHAGGQAKASLGRADQATPQAQFPFSYVWVNQSVSLTKGPAKIRIAIVGTAPNRRTVDAVVMTTDTAWKPSGRAFPPMAYSEYLQKWAKDRKPLAPLSAHRSIPSATAWPMPQTAGRDFWYLGAGEFTAGFPKPVHVRDEFSQGTASAYARYYGGKPDEAPVFSSPVVGVKLVTGEVKKLLDPADPMRKYILANKVPFVFVGNYSSAGQVPNSYANLVRTFGDLWVGIVSGEGSYLGLPLHPPAELPHDANFKQNNYQWLLSDGKAPWRTALQQDWASTISNPFEKFILCSSVGTLMNVHRMAEAGAQVLGTESAAAMPYAQQQMAFARGAARQYGRKWMWYYGASFGDAIRTFTKEGPYELKIEGISVNNRNETIGPSLAHLRRVLLHSYLQGASFFFPEQGYNLLGPDGKLNPMGWSYDEMIRLATRHPQRGSIYTPVAVLLDRAHGWEKYDYVGMHVWNTEPLSRADRMIDGFFNVAYYPFPKNEGDPADDLNVPFPNGYFGDIFDVVVTSPTRVEAINAYPVVFCVGDTRLDSKWAAALKQYVENGGTLVINAEQVVPGLDENFLGAKLSSASKEASVVKCLPDGEQLSSTIFPYRVVAPTSGKVIATTDGGDPVALVNRVGKGKVILTTPSYLLGHDLVPTPYMARLMLHVTSGLLPVSVQGNCEHYVNLHPQGYVVVLSHNEGIAKLSHSPATMNRQNTSKVTLRMKETPLKTEDWIGEQPQSWTYPNEWLPEYTQPAKLDWQTEGDGHTATITLQPGEIRAFFIQTR